MSELILHDSQAVTLQRPEPSAMDLIQAAMSTPGLDSDRMGVIERLMAMKERMDDQSRRNAYAAAMTALQAELPQINKRGKIMTGTGTSEKVRSTYARIEDLDAQVRPYLAKHGFAFSYDTRPADKPSEIRIIGTMLHSAGHSETKQIDMPIETGAMSDQQKRGSTLSHGIKAIMRMFLNLVMVGEDNDAQGDPELITAKDLAKVQELLAAISGDSAKVLAWLKVERFEDIQRRDVPKALAFLRAKVGEKK